MPRLPKPKLHLTPPKIRYKTEPQPTVSAYDAAQMADLSAAASPTTQPEKTATQTPVAQASTASSSTEGGAGGAARAARATETPVTEPRDPETQTRSEPPSLFSVPPMAEQERMVEAILFASLEPISIDELAERMPEGCDPFEALAYLERRYEGRGVRLVRVGEAWAFRTAPDLGHLMRKEQVETRKLSRAAVETLAIVAYHQPVTRTEIEEIRGVAVSRGTIDQLLELEWIRFGRRRMSPGRPVTFVVTEEFLDHFGLESARDLPGLRELRAAGLLDSRPMPGSAPELEEIDEEDEPAEQAELFKDVGRGRPSGRLK